MSIKIMAGKEEGELNRFELRQHQLANLTPAQIKQFAQNADTSELREAIGFLLLRERERA